VYNAGLSRERQKFAAPVQSPGYLWPILGVDDDEPGESVTMDDAMGADEVDVSRRKFLTGATAATGAVGAVFALVPFVQSWSPSGTARSDQD
jgi:hypothetical protein